MNENCWLKDECNHIDCNTFCMRNFKLDYLYNEALITIPQRTHRNLRVDDDGSDLEEFKLLKNVEENIVDFINNGKNIYIHSNICGNGKTSWALRLIQSYFNKIWIKSSLECRGLFIDVPRFLLTLKDNINEKSEYIQHIKENVLDCDVVIWDEIGSKGLTVFEHENVLSIVSARIDSGKSNIYTSNLDHNELHSVVGDRLYSRIVNLSEDVCFKGSNKRGI